MASLGVILLIALAVFAHNARRTAQAASAANLPEAPAQPDTSGAHNCRYGIYALYTNQTAPWLPTFGAGWYVNPGINPASTPPANHARFVHTLRMKNGEFEPPLSSIDSILAQNPGETWLVGNEIEVDNPSTGDGTYPWDYARVYHQAYHYIKERDPSAQVGIGGMSMATPGRLQYLDFAWDTYLQTYGVPMPVDVWNIHLYILNESKHFGNLQGDGKVALGTDPAIAKKAPNGPASVECPKEEVYCRAEHDSIEIFAAQLRDLRAWMKNHGQQNKPLIITEFSQLFQPGNTDEFGEGWPPSRVIDYMQATLEFLENEKDPAIGYPADEYRLVQQWMWYSTVTEPGWSGHASDLLKQDYANYPPGAPGALTAVGEAYHNAIAARAVSVNLKAGAAATVTTNESSAQLSVGLRNTGNTVVTQPVQVTFYADAALTNAIGTTVIDPVIHGCTWNQDSHTAAITWNNLAPGVYRYWAKVDSNNGIAEADESDNVASGMVYVNAPPTATPTPTPPADTQPPDVVWTAPVGNGGVYAVTGTENVTLAVTATDDTAVTQVTFSRWDAAGEQWITIDIDASAPYQASLASSALNNGWNQINAVAHDAAGNVSPGAHIWLYRDAGGPGASPTPTTAPIATATPTLTPTPPPDDLPSLALPQQAPAFWRRPVDLPLSFTSRGADVNAAVFAIDLDMACVVFNAADSNNDGVIDAVASYLPAAFNLSARYNPTSPAGELEFVISANPGATAVLPDGVLLNITLLPTCLPPREGVRDIAINFAPITFGTAGNETLNGAGVDGSLRLTPLETIYLPIIVKR
jgi:hypothetical protein